MSKIPCKVVQDLLPLYDDGVCSVQSSDLVEEHLEECDICTEIYKTMKKEIPEIDEGYTKPEDLSAVALLKILRKKTIVRDIIIALLIIAVGTAVLTLLTKVFTTISCVPAEEVSVSEVYELENGNIYFRVNNMAYEWVPGMSAEIEDGDVVMQISYVYNWATKISGWNKDVEQRFPDPWIFDLSAAREELGEVELSRIVYFDWDSSKETVIWEKGDDLPKAPKEVEADAKGLQIIDYISLIPSGEELDSE